MNTKLGKMQKVELREIFKNEASDFTPWLAQEDNIALLGEVLGLELEVQKQEANVGSFRADILCKEAQSGKAVLVENQIEPTDHGHLGQLLTYAGGLDAAFVVWIAQKFAEEHRAALNWLNEKFEGVEDAPGFFGVEVELWRIGSSEPAPRFNVVAKPNDWSTSVKRVAREAGLTEKEQLRLKYWSKLCEHLLSTRSTLQPNSAGARKWIGLKSPVKNFSLGFWTELNGIGTYIGFSGEEASKLIAQIRVKHAKDFERDVGEEIDWPEASNADKRYYVRVWRDADSSDESDWPAQHQWLKDAGEKFARAFPKYVELVSKRK